MSLYSGLKEERRDSRLVLRRRTLRALIVFWVLTLPAIPIVAQIESTGVFLAYVLFSFLCAAVFFSITPVRRIPLEILSGRKRHPALKKLSAAAIVTLILAFVLAAVCMFRLAEGGPEIKDGVYCLWNHGFVREITREEYLRLRATERSLFCAGIAGLSSFYLLFCCFVNEII